MRKLCQIFSGVIVIFRVFAAVKVYCRIVTAMKLLQKNNEGLFSIFEEILESTTHVQLHRAVFIFRDTVITYRRQRRFWHDLDRHYVGIAEIWRTALEYEFC